MMWGKAAASSAAFPIHPMRASTLLLSGLSLFCAVGTARGASPAESVAVESHATGRQLKIEGLNAPLTELKLSDFDGRDLSGVLRPRTENGEVQVALARPMQFVVKPREIGRIALRGQEKVILPGGVVVPLIAQPDGSTDAKSAWFRLTLIASPMPAPWSPDSADYVTRLTFGLRRPPQLSEDVALERPVIVKLGFNGLTAADVPAIALEAAGLEHEKTVELRFQPRTAAPTLLVRSTISDVDLELSALARLEVRPLQQSMLGFGLETVPVVIESVLAHGAPLAMDRATPVLVQVSRGARLEGEQVELPAGGSSATVRVRSTGLVPVTLTASAAGLTGRAVIEQQFPAGPLIAALLGGALGGFARRFLKGARRSRGKRHLIEGLVVGLLAFVAGVLGVGYLELPAAIVATEAGAFLTGALAGFAGVTVLELLAKKPANADG